MDPDQLSKAFVEHYYSTFDSNTPNLLGLFQESSMLSFEGEKIQGAQNISNKLSSLPFQQCKHDISTVDCQPSGPAGGMMVFVSICNYQARNTLLNSARCFTRFQHHREASMSSMTFSA